MGTSDWSIGGTKGGKRIEQHTRRRWGSVSVWQKTGMVGTVGSLLAQQFGHSGAEKDGSTNFNVAMSHW